MLDFKSNPQIKSAIDKKRQRNRFLLVSALVLIGTIFATRYIKLPDHNAPEPQSNVQELPIPAIESVQISTEPPVVLKTPKPLPEVTKPLPTMKAVAALEALPEPETNVSTHKIRSGESLAAIFADRNFSANLLHRIVHSSKTAAQLAHIRPGQILRFETDSQGELSKLSLQRDRINSLHILATDQGFEATERAEQVDIKVSEVAGTINSSLFIDGQNAGLADAQIMELAGIFGWDIDFALEIRSGDRFSLIYEEQYLDGEKFANGPILAAEFINKDKRYRAIRYTDSKDNVGYYDEEGRNKRRTFIRTPLKFARVSSGFTTKRWHPVLKRWRSHKGVDYAASRGTPVKTTGNGKVTFRGKKGGYGNVIFVQHGSTYTTVYAHLSKFSRKARQGKKVRQGDIIGYVGSTGLATGPHLHYEFRVNGVHRNPLTVKLPKSNPLPKTELTVFKLNSKTILTQLDKLNSSNMVASAASQRDTP